MKTALVTGASSGIGQAICKKMTENGIFVYGIGRKFENSPTNSAQIQNKQHSTLNSGNTKMFQRITCDLTDLSAIEKAIKPLAQKAQIDILVNCAGVGYYGLHESLNPAQITEMTQTNINAPMVLTNLLLPSLKTNHGTIINISSVTAHGTNTHGCAYGATKAALTSFSNSLFAEVRKHGVKVICIEPDMTDTNLYRNANFTVSDDKNAYLSPETVANTCMFALSAPQGTVVTNLTVRPQKHQIKKRTFSQE